MQINSEIQGIEANDLAGGLVMTHPKPTRDGFLDNFRKLQLNEQQLQKLQIQMTDPICDRESVSAEKEKVV